jgi:hypothetical protein
MELQAQPGTNGIDGAAEQAGLRSNWCNRINWNNRNREVTERHNQELMGQSGATGNKVRACMED